MTGNDRAAIMKRQLSLLAVASLSLILLSSCTDFRRALGMDRVGPDEFAVESRAPLTIPPDFDLRPPSPGAPRPQEATAADRARTVIDTAGPGEPGKQASSALRPPPGGVSAPAGGGPDVSQQVGDRSLAAKLLSSTDSPPPAGAEKRETTPLKGGYGT